jgi:hypothetical protein
MACITGKYPTPLAQTMADVMKAKFMSGYQETGRIYEPDEACLLSTASDKTN